MLHQALRVAALDRDPGNGQSRTVGIGGERRIHHGVEVADVTVPGLADVDDRNRPLRHQPLGEEIRIRALQDRNPASHATGALERPVEVRRLAQDTQIDRLRLDIPGASELQAHAGQSAPGGDADQLAARGPRPVGCDVERLFTHIPQPDLAKASLDVVPGLGLARVADEAVADLAQSGGIVSNLLVSDWTHDGLLRASSD